MPESNHDNLRRLFDLVIAAAPTDRSSLLDRECRGDAGLRKRIETMVAAAEDDRFLGEPTRGDAAEAPTGDSSTATAAAMAMSLREGPGTRIGPYKLLQAIGEGGFGRVFMAEQEQPVQRKVALKIIKLGMDTRQVVARFEQERQALAMMDHPNIARVLDAGATDTGRPFFVMELVKGDPIVEYCDKNNLSIQDRLELFAQVCNAVQHAHTKGIIHRDIKPSNILVSTQDGRPHTKVIDFGIAKATASKLTEKTLFTEHRQLIGTPEYMSPEQAEGSLDIDTRTDVYSLGVLLYELLTGTTPFSSEGLRSAAYAEIQRIIREVEPPRPSTRLSHSTDAIAGIAAKRHTEPKKLGTIIRGELDWIVMKALEKDRLRRYETANGLSMDIRRYLAGETVLAAPPSTVYRLRKFVRRNRVMVSAGSAVAGALVLGLGVALAGLVGAIKARNAETLARESEAEQRSAAVRAAHEAQESAVLARESEAKAIAQKQRAVEIGVFLREVLELADPSRDGAQVSLVDVLRKSDAMFKDRFADQPDVERELRETVGKTFLQLQAYREAEPHLLRAIELAFMIDPPNLQKDGRADVVRWNTRWLAPLVKAKSLMGESAQLPGLLTELAGRLERQRGAEDPGVMLLRSESAGLSAFGDQPTFTPPSRPARPSIERRVEAQRAKVQELAEHRGALDPQTIDAKFDLAALLTGEDQAQESTALYEEATAAEAKVRPATDPARQRHTIKRAVAMSRNEPLGKRAEFLWQAVRQVRADAGGDTQETIDTLVLISYGQVGGARIATLREALEAAERKFGPAHQTTQSVCGQLAGMLVATDPDGAEQLILSNVAAIEKSAGSKSFFYKSARANYGRFLASRNRHAEAVPVLQEVIDDAAQEMAYNAPGGPDAWLVYPRGVLAQSLIELKRWDEAERTLLWLFRAGQDPAGVNPEYQRHAGELLVSMYQMRDSAEPGKGYDARAAEWKAKIDAAKATPGAPYEPRGK